MAPPDSGRSGVSFLIGGGWMPCAGGSCAWTGVQTHHNPRTALVTVFAFMNPSADRKSTRLNSSHLVISYAVFCLKKKKKQKYNRSRNAVLRARHLLAQARLARPHPPTPRVDSCQLLVPLAYRPLPRPPRLHPPYC